MNKILIAAALMAAAAMPATAVSAASATTAAAPKPAPVCFVLPLLPDCVSTWKAEHDAVVAKVATAPKVSMAAPKLWTPPSCTKAAAGAGHLYECK